MTTSFQSPLDTGLAHHRAGRLPQAEQAYRQILAQNPNDADALHLLGLLAHQVGHTQAGIEHIERAVALKPDPQFLSNLGELYRAAGQFDRGIACCRRAIALAPNLPAAHTNLAALLQATNRIEEGLAVARQSVALSPQDGASHRILGNLHLAMNRVEDAAAELQKATQLNPQDAAAWANLGICNERLAKLDVALQCHARATQLSPQSAEMLANLGHVLVKCNRPADAVTYLQRATQANANLKEAQEGLAAALEQVNRFDEAIAIAKTLITREPRRMQNHCVLANSLMNSARLEESEVVLKSALEIESTPDLHQIYAVCLARLGRFSDSLREIDIAIAMRPQWVEAHFSKALILMFDGKLEESWDAYEWRWQHPRMDSWRHKTDKPRWDGRPLDGQRIFLYAEQGLGDTIYFARYATLIAERGGYVVMEVQKGLREIIQTVPGVREVIVRGEKVPPFDTHAPLLSLPGIFHTNLQNIPASVPYITADPAKAEQWRKIIGDAGGKLKVGIGWEGGPFQRENHLRSTKLEAFAPLAAVPGVRFYSLQKGPAAQQASSPPAAMDLVNLDQHIHDFSDTTAAIANLDLVISIDTSVIHVAGALAKPVWNLLGLHLGHMWMSGRDDSPWYPTMRLFRQPKLGQWPPVMERVAAELGKFVESRNA